jgi:ribonuclease P protein component
MIARKHRFHGHGALNFLYRKGRSARSDFITLKFVPARQADFKLAIVVSKKVHKSAVVRNRIRRRLFEAVRTIKQEHNQLWPYDMVITVFDDSVATMHAVELQKSVFKVLKQSKIV